MTNKKVQHDIFVYTERTKKSEQYYIIRPIILGNIIKATPQQTRKSIVYHCLS